MGSVHPIVVNFAITILGAGIAADFLGVMLKLPKVRGWAGYLVWGGGVFTLIAVLSGNDALHALADRNAVEDIAPNHKLFGQLTLWSTILMLVLRQLAVKGNRWIKSGFLMLLLLTAGLLFQTATLGGEMDLRLHPQGEQPPNLEKPSFK